MTRYLNKKLKTKIRCNIRDSVKKKMEKSIPGKELAEIHDKLVAFLTMKIKKKFTAKEVVVLKKYGHTTTVSNLTLTKNNNRLASPWHHNGLEFFTLRFTPKIEAPNIPTFYNYSLRNTLENNKEMKALALHGVKTFNHIECEIDATTNAYMEIIDTYRTVTKFVKDYPDLETYIPEAEAVSSPVVSKKAQSIIKNFEAA